MKVKEIIEKMIKYDPEEECYISPYACPGDTVNDITNNNGIIEIE